MRQSAEDHDLDFRQAIVLLLHKAIKLFVGQSRTANLGLVMDAGVLDGTLDCIRVHLAMAIESKADLIGKRNKVIAEKRRLNECPELLLFGRWIRFRQCLNQLQCQIIDLFNTNSVLTNIRKPMRIKTYNLTFRYYRLLLTPLNTQP